MAVIPMPPRPTYSQREQRLEFVRQVELSLMSHKLAMAIVRIIKKDDEWQREDMSETEFQKFRQIAERAILETVK
jgi:hypothetical protein